LLGYLRYDSEAAREARNDLCGQKLRLFQNLFLPSVELARKERIGSRWRRYERGFKHAWKGDSLACMFEAADPGDGALDVQPSVASGCIGRGQRCTQPLQAKMTWP
jgi:hypothetical protein